MAGCRQCGEPTPLGCSGKPKVFCSGDCDRLWRSAQWKGNKLRAGRPPVNAFPAGHTPWTKGLKGIHLSPGTEFKPGPRPELRAGNGRVRIRKRKRDGRSRAWVKIVQPNVWKLRAVLVWEQAHGPLAPGFLIHHIDRDTLNDSLDNLAALSRAAHLNDHRPEFEETRSRNAIAARWGRPDQKKVKRKVQ